LTDADALLLLLRMGEWDLATLRVFLLEEELLLLLRLLFSDMAML
jgi:hypothetical protein